MEGIPWSAVADKQSPLADLRIHGLTHDSRRVQPGYAFVAVSGHEADGNQFADEAVRRGASVVVTDRPEAVPPVTVPVVVVPHIRPALARMAANFYGHPAQDLIVVGITGTLGKTSTADFLYSILKRAGPAFRPGLIGSLGVRYGSYHEVTGLTTPDALTLQRVMAAMRADGVRIVVMEVSSHAQLQSRVAEIPFAMGVFLNLVPGEHMDVHPSFDHYAQTKMQLLAQIRPDGVLLYNTGDPEVVRRIGAAEVEGRLRSATFRVAAAANNGAIARVEAPPSGWKSPGAEDSSVTEGAEADAAHPTPRGAAPSLTLVEQGGATLAFASSGEFPAVSGDAQLPVRFRVPWQLRGLQSRWNALAAASAALALGVEASIIAEGLASTLPSPRRMQEVYRGSFRVVDDTTGHPASFDALFRWLRSTGAEGIVLVTAVRGNRGVDINRANARTIGAWAKRLPLRHLVVTAAADATEARDRVRPDEWEAFRTEILQHDVSVQFFHTLDPALRAALSEVRPGDILMLAGAQGLDQAFIRLRRWLPTSTPTYAKL